jgi:hypothetical protein
MSKAFDADKKCGLKSVRLQAKDFAHQYRFPLEANGFVHRQQMKLCIFWEILL